MIRLDAVSRRYGEVLAVDRVSLELAPGELLALVGGSGCGKTTTLKMCNRLIEPTEGRIFIGGEDVTGLAPHTLRRRIGYAEQRLGLFPHMSVAQNIGVTPRLLGWEPARIQERVATLLALVELEPALAERRPAALSGGQAQRVAVARALAAEPPVLLMDEPFGALDPLTRERLQRSFDAIRRKLRLSVIFVTHDMMEAALLADRVAVMREGRVVQIGSPAELARAPADAGVEELMSAPRRQAALVAERLSGTTAGETP